MRTAADLILQWEAELREALRTEFEKLQYPHKSAQICAGQLIARAEYAWIRQLEIKYGDAESKRFIKNFENIDMALIQNLYPVTPMIGISRDTGQSLTLSDAMRMQEDAVWSTFRHALADAMPWRDITTHISRILLSAKYVINKKVQTEYGDSALEAMRGIIPGNIIPADRGHDMHPSP